MDNIIPQDYLLSREHRVKLKKHRSFVIWFTGLSGSGKSTIANRVEYELYKKGVHTYALDGDNLRSGLSKNLGFSEEDRTENQRRIAEVAKLFLESGTVVLAAFISPLESQRELTKKIVGEENYLEIYVKASLEKCEERDVKGLYKKARAGEIKNFTGIDAPYEAPENPDLVIDTEDLNVEKAAKEVLEFVEPKLGLKK